MALCLYEPTVVAFLTERGASGLPPDWKAALHEDKLKPPRLGHDLFTLTSEEVLREVVADCLVEYMHGSDLVATENAPPVLLAFRAGEVGLAIRAARMEVLTDAGTLQPDEVLEAVKAWWVYWREYWRRKSTAAPLPKDFVCEVTIPIK